MPKATIDREMEALFTDEQAHFHDATLDTIENEIAKRSLITFTERTKPNYLTGWFHREVAAALDQFLEDVKNKKSPRLILTAPPQHGKSELVSRRFPARAFGENPDLRIIGTSYGADLAQGFNSDIQKIIDSPIYTAIYPNTKIIGDNSRGGRDRYNRRNSEEFTIIGYEGSYRCAGRGGALTGKSADLLIIDDPLKDWEEAISETIRESAFNWLVTTAMTRVQEGGGIIVMATRWSLDDIIGRLTRLQKGTWKLINFPAIAEEDEPNRKRGECLTKERYSTEYLIAIRDGKATPDGQQDSPLINSYQWSAVYQQRPSPEGGGLFKRRDWRYYDIDVFIQFDGEVQSWDMSFKDLKTSDFVSGLVIAYKGANKYLRDRVNERLGFRATKDEVRAMSLKWPKTWRKYVEDKANGTAVIDDLTGEIPGLIAVEPEGGKIARAHAVSGDVEAHNVYLPARKNLQTGMLVPLPWVEAFIGQLENFPTGVNDDDVDAFTQGLTQIRKIVMGPTFSDSVVVQHNAVPEDFQHTNWSVARKVF